MPFGWTRYVLDRISGLQVRRGAEQSINDASRDRADFRQFYQDCGSEVACTGPREYSQQGRKAPQEDIDNLRLATRAMSVEEAFLPWEWDRRVLESGWDMKAYRR